MKRLLMTAAFLIGCAAPAYATCGVNGYWGTECGTPTQPGPTTNDATGIGVGVGIGTGVGVGLGGSGVGHGGQGGAGGNATASGGQGGNAVATGRGGNASVRGSGNSRSQSAAQSNNSVQVNNSTRVRSSAAGAAPVILNGYGAGNCFGDTNPSGSFGATMQTFGWGVGASSSKASNVCSVYAIGGPAAAAAYLAAQDPNAHRALVAAGVVKTKTVQQPQQGRVTVSCPASHPRMVEVKGQRRCYK